MPGRSVFEGFCRNDEGVRPLAHDRRGATKAPETERAKLLLHFVFIFYILIYTER